MISYRFGRFLLEPERRCLSADGKPIQLSSRGLDLLHYLIEHRDRVVAKDDIIAAVWQGASVEENNLAVQMSALRRTLGEGNGRVFIVTVPSRGYRFVAEVTEHPPDTPPAKPAPKRWRPAAAAAGLALTAALAWFALHHEPAPRLSIAVLPFRNLGGDASQDYLADAITDDLTTDLAHLPNSVVIARESADTYRGRAATAQSIGRALNVRYLLEGSLRPESGSLHLNAQLIDASTAGHVWAGGFDVAHDDLPTARTTIVRHLASTLDVTLVQVEAARSLHERPNQPDAVDLYLRARSRLDRDDSLAGLIAAQALLEQAIAAAPHYGDALAELGQVLLHKIGDYDDPDEWRDHARAQAAIAAAMAAAPRNPLTITASGMLAWEDEQCDQALPRFRLALALDPDQIQAADGIAHCARDLGQMPEMIATLQDLLRRDPAAPANAARQNLIGLGTLMLGQPAQAVSWLERARAADPQAAATALGWQEWNRLYLIAATWQAGDRAGAAALYAGYAKTWPHRTVWLLDSYHTRAFSAAPGHARLLAAWRAVGMPQFADEAQDFGAAQPADGDFDPTPLDPPGLTRLDTPMLHALLATTPAPLVLDVGRGAAALPGAVVVWPQGVWGDSNRMLDAAAAGPRARPVVVLGDGPFGPASLNAARHLIASGMTHVLWYRGGEQAWVQAGYPARDLRAQ